MYCQAHLNIDFRSIGYIIQVTRVTWSGRCEKVIAMVEFMSLEEQVDVDFTVARRRARLRRLKAFLLRRAVRGTLLRFEEIRRSLRATGGIDRGRGTVETSRIVGSAGKHDQFDDQFMPLAKASAERWKRIDRALRRGHESYRRYTSTSWEMPTSPRTATTG